ncbi:hypothetical protein ABH892_004441 [Paenibacillus sp. RC254]|uniref:hypothetical protein n=1 Tax=unclassified Paenibacillus TaxID=185978 RepID=UPI0024B896AC|nr:MULTISPECIES: hypothetical protein [unclassified Paenibacillus]
MKRKYDRNLNTYNNVNSQYKRFPNVLYNGNVSTYEDFSDIFDIHPLLKGRVIA